MKGIASIAILLCLVLLASGQAAAQQFGTKVQTGDPDVGLPLSTLSITPFPTPQNVPWVAYWDIGTTPGVYDDKDVLYLQFGSVFAGKIVLANNIRLTGWGNYPAGSYVKPGDSDIGQQIVPLPPGIGTAFLGNGFFYMDVSGGTGYDMGDPVYLKVTPVPATTTNTNDIRITPNAGFPAGSRVSLNDPDANKPLTPFDVPTFAAGNLLPQVAIGSPIATLSFYNANGNIFLGPPANQPIYDEGDVVYFDVNPLNIVSPNDIRLY